MFSGRFLLAAVFVALSVTGANAACGPFPTSKYLGTYTHAEIKDYVANQHNGAWAPYLSLLKENLIRLREKSAAGNGALLRVKGTATPLTERELARFIYVSQQWLDVARCLSNQTTPPQTALSVDDLTNFATAAGGDVSAPRESFDPSADIAAPTAEELTATQPRDDDRLLSYLAQQDTQVANVSDQKLAVRIETVCNAGYTSFKITNDAGTWPDVGTFSIFRLIDDNKQLISARRVTMNANDKKTFTVTPKQNHTGRVGISISPSWYERPFTMDAAASCEK